MLEADMVIVASAVGLQTIGRTHMNAWLAGVVRLPNGGLSHLSA